MVPRGATLPEICRKSNPVKAGKGGRRSKGVFSCVRSGSLFFHLEDGCFSHFAILPRYVYTKALRGSNKEVNTFL